MKTYRVLVQGVSLDVKQDDDGKFIIPNSLEGLGTCLKPAAEFWWLVRKPLGEKTVAANVLKHGTGALNIDASRIGAESLTYRTTSYRDASTGEFSSQGQTNHTTGEKTVSGRFPANLVFSHSEGCKLVGKREVKAAGGAQNSFDSTARNSMGEMPKERNWEPHGNGDGTETVEAWECASDCAVRALDEQSLAGGMHSAGKARASKRGDQQSGLFGMPGGEGHRLGDSGGASRFFKTFAGESRFLYCAKASKKDKGANNSHPTVKSTALMQYLIKLVTPPGGTVLDPFMGSGSTGVAALSLGHGFYGIEKEPEYFEIACGRIAEALEKIPGEQTPTETTTEEESQDSTEEMALAENQ